MGLGTSRREEKLQDEIRKLVHDLNSTKTEVQYFKMVRVREKEPWPTGHNLASWRLDPTLASDLSVHFSTPLFRHVFSVLLNALPTGAAVGPTTEASAALALGQVQGYMHAINLFRSLAVVPTEHQEMEATYEDEKEADSKK